jgi:hypothetical protein
MASFFCSLLGCHIPSIDALLSSLFVSYFLLLYLLKRCIEVEEGSRNVKIALLFKLSFVFLAFVLALVLVSNYTQNVHRFHMSL